MKYAVSIHGTTHEIEVLFAPDGVPAVCVDGDPRPVDAIRVPGGVSLRIGDALYDVVFGRDAAARVLASRAYRALVTVEDARSARCKSLLPPASASELRSPMPGRIVKLLVAVGDPVSTGQPLVVMEAMKMENELRAESAARIAAVEVAEGQSVEGNTVLIRFEPANDGAASPG